MDSQVLVELHRPKEPSGATSLVVYENGQARATGAVPGGEQAFVLPAPTRGRVKAAVATVAWQDVPEVLGDVSREDTVLRCAGREIHLGLGTRETPRGLLGVVAELTWILVSARHPLLLHVTRSAQFTGDPRWMSLRIDHDGSVELGTVLGSARGGLGESELARLTGILDGMRFTELDVRDIGFFDWQLVHGYNRVVLEADTMDRGFVPLLQLCGEIEVRLLRELPPPPAGA